MGKPNIFCGVCMFVSTLGPPSNAAPYYAWPAILCIGLGRRENPKMHVMQAFVNWPKILHIREVTSEICHVAAVAADMVTLRAPGP